MTIEIMLPFWGEPRMLFQTVASVQAQSDPAWRMTVIDDAYPDDSVAAWFAELDDDRIVYTRNERNAGIIANFRASVQRASADHLVILGSDDLLGRGYVAAVRRAIAAHPDADIIQPGVDVIDQNDQPSMPLADRVKQRMLAPDTTGGDVVLTGEPLATSLVKGDWLYWPSLVFRTETIRRHDFRDDLPIALDLAILLDIVFDGGRLVAIPERVFFYRRHSGSASQQTLLDGRRFTDDRRFYREIVERATARGWRSTASAARTRLLARLHAVTEAPRVLRHGTPEGRKALWHHIFG
ncbi:glycosyltransferase family 2 protein [Microbacterium sp. A93]|uniref:glycosyltransferase family 2 protein n=1 Tax=Microbacterium sp. A93 TaxID=3450716 RepID=UPI003F428A02